ncbi:MAG: dephospho-CoA kinase [Proteobacteria bacterium]|nr:dephospho-CoA kinase [Pseudomonadota bacterium]
MLILGLTGSIGMGKTVAANNFRRLGLPVHDADKAVHELTGAGGEAADMIAKMFPEAVVKGALNREALAKRAFGDPDALVRLEKILHPMVRKRERRFLERSARQGCRQVVLDIPLLFETGAEDRCDGVITVSAPRFLQERRVLRRPGMTRERLDSILARQIPDVEKRRRSDFVVLTGLGRDFSLLQILNVVRLTRDWQGRNWPPRSPVHPPAGSRVVARSRS